MSEFVIKIEDDIVQSLGRQTIEYYLQQFIKQTILKVAANDILQDYNNTNFENDKNWLKAQKTAFQNDKYSQYIKIYANV